MYIVILLCAIIGLLAVRRYFKSQDHAIDQIANHPELSDEKADAIARISTKQHRKLVNHHSPICINIHLIYLFSLEGKSSRLSSILFILYLFVICYKTLN